MGMSTEGPLAEGTSAPDWTSRAHTLANSASRATELVPGVVSADFRISGSPGAPALEIDCTVLQDEDPSPVIELVTHATVEDLEELIGTPFVQRDIQVMITEDAAAPQAHPHLAAVPGLGAGLDGTGGPKGVEQPQGSGVLDLATAS